MPGNIASYDEFNNLSIFKFSKTFRMSKDKSFPEFRDMVTQYTFLISPQDKSFPNIVRKFRIKETKELLSSPVQNAIKNIEDKVIEFHQLVLSHKLDVVPDTNKLSMQLNGVLDAAVNGGVQKYIDAFFVPDFLKPNPQEVENLQRFQRALVEQLIFLKQGLECYKQFGSVKTRPHCEHLENLYVKMKEQLEKNLLKFDFSPYSK
jgi:hypothetical protein